MAVTFVGTDPGAAAFSYITATQLTADQCQWKKDATGDGWGRNQSPDPLTRVIPPSRKFIYFVLNIT